MLEGRVQALAASLYLLPLEWKAQHCRAIKKKLASVKGLAQAIS